jgi:hypothetical protein
MLGYIACGRNFQNAFADGFATAALVAFAEIAHGG